MAKLDRAFMKVFNFRGELSRKKFALYFFSCFAIAIASSVAGGAIDQMIIYEGLPEGWILLPILFSLAALVAYISAIVRRVRDTGFGVLFTVLCIIASLALPIAGLFISIFLMIQPHREAEGTFAQKIKPALLVVSFTAIAYALFYWGGLFFTTSGCTLPIDLVMGDTCVFGSLIASIGATLALTLLIGVPLALLAYFLRSKRT